MHEWPVPLLVRSEFCRTPQIIFIFDRLSLSLAVWRKQGMDPRTRGRGFDSGCPRESRFSSFRRPGRHHAATLAYVVAGFAPLSLARRAAAPTSIFQPTASTALQPKPHDTSPGWPAAGASRDDCRIMRDLQLVCQSERMEVRFDREK